MREPVSNLQIHCVKTWICLVRGRKKVYYIARKDLAKENRDDENCCFSRWP